MHFVRMCALDPWTHSQLYVYKDHVSFSQYMFAIFSNNSRQVDSDDAGPHWLRLFFAASLPMGLGMSAAPSLGLVVVRTASPGLAAAGEPPAAPKTASSPSSPSAREILLLALVCR